MENNESNGIHTKSQSTMVGKRWKFINSESSQTENGLTKIKRNKFTDKLMANRYTQ